MTSNNTSVSLRLGSRPFAGPLAAGVVMVLAAACSSSSGSDGGTQSAPITTLCGSYTPGAQPAAVTCASPGGEVTGTKDAHCVMNGMQMTQVTTMCPMGPVASDDAASDDAGNNAADDGSADAASGSTADAGPDDGTCGDDDYQPTMNGHVGSDDDCKYDVSWTSTPICENGNVYFTVMVSRRAGDDGKPALMSEPPLTGASVSAEVYYNDCATIAPNSGQATTEMGNGQYKVGPIKFNKSGNWVVRFHFNECCSDDPEDSPHGHAAFWVNVP